jgi:putative glutamine amidotransferase
VERDLYYELHHEVVFETSSKLADLYGEGARLRINSIHHQSIKRLGNGLVVEARSPDDGVIEAIRWTGSSFVMGLQWHPEFHARDADRLLDSGPIISEFLHHSFRTTRAVQVPRRGPRG